MRESLNVYRILLPPLFGLCCTCLTINIPTVNVAQMRNHLHSRPDNYVKKLLPVVRKGSALNFAGNSKISYGEFLAVVSNSSKIRKRRSAHVTKQEGKETKVVTLMTSPTSTPPQGNSSIGKEFGSLSLHFQKPRQDPPDFMVQLFHLLSSVHSHRFENTVVTSYININLQDERSLAEDKLSYVLAFNGTSARGKEDIDHAELRVFFQTVSSSDNERIKKHCLYHINIYEIFIHDNVLLGRNSIFSENRQLDLNLWNAFDLTYAAQEWDTSRLHVIEMAIRSIATAKEKTPSDFKQSQRPSECAVRAITNPGDHRDPILVVFAKKAQRQRKRRKREAVETNDVFNDGSLPVVRKNIDDNDENNDNSYFSEHFVNNSNSPLTYDSKVNTDTSWFQYIKTSLQNQSQSQNISHEYDIKSEDKRTVAQKLKSSLNSKHKKLDAHRAATIWSHRRRRDVRTVRNRYKRSFRNRKNRRHRNSCRRKEMFVDFQKIAWNDFIMFPNGYQAYKCVGHCYFPINSHLTPTKHAIIQTLYHRSQPRHASRACCVPTRLAPISVLFVDNGNMRYEYTYADMVAAQCGCR